MMEIRQDKTNRRYVNQEESRSKMYEEDPCYSWHFIRSFPLLPLSLHTLLSIFYPIQCIHACIYLCSRPCIALSSVALHNVALNSIARHSITWRGITPHCTGIVHHSTTLRCVALHGITYYRISELQFLTCQIFQEFRSISTIYMSVIACDGDDHTLTHS